MTTQMSKIPTPKCFQCGKEGELEIPTEIWFTGLKKSQEGALIQNAFPTLSHDQREQLLTGIHPECWKKMFPAEEE